MSRGELKKLLKTCKQLEDKISQVLSDVEDILFLNKSDSVTRLLPSFYDREHFSNIFNMDKESVQEGSNTEDRSYQKLATIFFSKRIQEEVAAQKVRII